MSSIKQEQHKVVVREQKKRKVAGGKISKSCEIFKAILPSVKSMEIHYESKHSKINFNDVR
jgi:hypothetical protein